MDRGVNGKIHFHIPLQIIHDRTTHIPIYELGFIWGVGPRVEEPGINLIRGFAYSAPLEDVKLKRP